MRKLLVSVLLVSLLALVGSQLAEARPIPINEALKWGQTPRG